MVVVMVVMVVTVVVWDIVEVDWPASPPLVVVGDGAGAF
jgi:hypothetical protein